MSSKVKFYLILGSSFISFAYSFTAPVLQIYFMGLVSAKIYAFSSMLTMALAALVNSSIPYDRIKQAYKNNFFFIVMIDVICFCIISFLSVEYVTVRFIGMSILSAVSSNIWAIVLRDAVNQVISGDNLTSWSAYYRSYELWFSFIGGLFAIFFTDINVETCIAIQCLANIIMGAGDMYSYKLLKEEGAKVAIDRSV